MKKILLLLTIMISTILFSGCATSNGELSPQVEKQKIFKPVYSQKEVSDLKFLKKNVKLGETVTIKVNKKTNTIYLKYLKTSINNYNIIKNKSEVYKFPIINECVFDTNINLLDQNLSKRKPVLIEFSCFKNNEKINKKVKITFNKKLNKLSFFVKDKESSLELPNIELHYKKNSYISYPFSFSTGTIYSIVRDIKNITKVDITELK